MNFILTRPILHFATTVKWKVATFNRFIRQLSNQLVDILNLIAGRSKTIVRIEFSLQVHQRSIMYFDSYRIQYTPSMSKIISSTWLAYQLARQIHKKGAIIYTRKILSLLLQCILFLEVNYETLCAIDYYCRLMTVNDLIALIEFPFTFTNSFQEKSSFWKWSWKASMMF